MKKKYKRFIKVGFIFAAVILVYALSVNFYIVSRSRSHLTTSEELLKGNSSADAIIVLGAGVRPDGSLSPMLKDRLDMGIRLYKQGAADCLLVSGDHGTEDYDEVNAMKSYAIEQGVPSKRIFMDHAGFSTYETICRAKNIFQVKKAVVVTQKYHMYRALYLANQLGIPADGVPCDTRAYRGAFYRGVREVFARNKDFLTAIVKPRPTYLGDVIPVSSNGDSTNDK